MFGELKLRGETLWLNDQRKPPLLQSATFYLTGCAQNYVRHFNIYSFLRAQTGKEIGARNTTIKHLKSM